MLFSISVIFMFCREIYPLQSVKRTAGFCFAFFMKLHENRSTHFVWHCFFCKKKKEQFFRISDALTNKLQQKQTTTNTSITLWIFLFNSLSLKKIPFSQFTLIFSVQTHPNCVVGKCLVLRVDHIQQYQEVLPPDPCKEPCPLTLPGSPYNPLNPQHNFP